MATTNLIVTIKVEGISEQQSKAMADHLESKIVRLIGDEHSSGNVSVIKFDTYKAT